MRTDATLPATVEHSMTRITRKQTNDAGTYRLPIDAGNLICIKLEAPNLWHHMLCRGGRNEAASRPPAAE
jgi:hypothetical protein